MVRTIQNLINLIQVFGSSVAGGYLYRNHFAPVDLALKKNVVLANEVALYAISSIAFACLVYVVTRPFAIVLGSLVEDIGKALSNIKTQ